MTLPWRVGCANGHTGKEDWSVHDFVGRYHAHKLEKNRQSLATPGTAVAVENERRDRELARIAKQKKINEVTVSEKTNGSSD